MESDEHQIQQVNIESLIEPIMQEFKSLKYTMAIQQGEMSEGFNHLKTVLKEQKAEIISEINVKVDHNSEQIPCLIDENTELRRENKDLKDHVGKIEATQLSNNIIITGIPKQPFETYEETKQCIYDTIASALLASDPLLEDNVLSEAQRVDIVYCSRIGRQRLGQNRPISMMLNRRDDKEKIMSIKSKLPQGIYINNEYPLHVKRARDTLRPILRLEKSLPDYQEKSRIEGDHLVINGTIYGLHDLHKLPPALSSYKVAQKEDDHTIALTCDTPFEAK